jgi:hypothetical protein
MTKQDSFRKLLKQVDEWSQELTILRNQLLDAGKHRNADDVQFLEGRLTDIKTDIVGRIPEVNESETRNNYLHDNVD